MTRRKIKHYKPIPNHAKDTLVSATDDENALQLLMEDATTYSKHEIETDDNLTETQWSAIVQAREQIKNGQFKSYEAVKAHFAQWLTR